MTDEEILRWLEENCDSLILVRMPDKEPYFVLINDWIDNQPIRRASIREAVEAAAPILAEATSHLKKRK